MNKSLLKIIALFLSLTLSLGILTSCGKQDTVDAEAIVVAAVKAAMESKEEPVSVTIVADDKYITIEDATGLSLQQLLDRAKITLNEGDILSFDTAQVIGSNLFVEVLRACHATVTVVAKDAAQNASYHIVLAGGTVADAIAVAGIHLENNPYVNYQMTDTIVDGMQIVISDNPGANVTTPMTRPIEDFITEDDPSEEDLPVESVPEPTARYEVSRDIYYDCDDSGHGVIVITYSDGSQEEVYF